MLMELKIIFYHSGDYLSARFLARLDAILNTSIIKRKNKFQFIKVEIFERKSPTVLDSVVDLKDVNILVKCMSMSLYM
jgi:hypothetical protein